MFGGDFSAPEAQHFLSPQKTEGTGISLSLLFPLFHHAASELTTTSVYSGWLKFNPAD
jgi:hypothetical protein